MLCEASIPIVYLSSGHWFYGISHGIHLRNAFDRVAQFQFAGDEQKCLAFARNLHWLTTSRMMRLPIRVMHSPHCMIVGEFSDVDKVPR